MRGEVTAILAREDARPLYIKQETRGHALIASLIDADNITHACTVLDLSAVT